MALLPFTFILPPKTLGGHTVVELVLGNKIYPQDKLLTQIADNVDFLGKGSLPNLKRERKTSKNFQLMSASRFELVPVSRWL